MIYDKLVLVIAVPYRYLPLQFSGRNKYNTRNKYL